MTLVKIYTLVFLSVNEDNNYVKIDKIVYLFTCKWYLLSVYYRSGIKIFHRIVVRFKWEHRSRCSIQMIIIDYDYKYY